MNGTFGGGNGSQATPYLVEDGADIVAIAGLNTTSYVYYFQQTQNIDLSSFATNTTGLNTGWISINLNNSNYNGAGFRISNMSMTDKTAGYSGLFGILLTGTIQNVRLAACNIVSNYNVKTANNYVGGIIASINGGNTTGATILNCIVQGIINCTTPYITSGSGKIDEDYVGGIVGKSSVTSNNVNRGIVNCTFIGTLTGRTYVGGIIGNYLDSGTGNRIRYCQFIGTINSAGITSLGPYLYTPTYTGGIAGYSSATTTYRCLFNGTITGSASIMGGIIGEGNSLNECACYANITNSESGLASNQTGLLAGSTMQSLTAVLNSYAIGSVTGSNYSFNSGAVDGGGASGAGGGGCVTNCYTSTSITSGANSYQGAFESGSSKTDVAPFNFYNSDLYTGTPGELYQGRTTAQLQDINTFLNDNGVTTGAFDFVNTWAIDPNINNGFPFLRWLFFGKVRFQATGRIVTIPLYYLMAFMPACAIESPGGIAQIQLVSTTDPKASPVRMNTQNGVMSWSE